MFSVVERALDACGGEWKSGSVWNEAIAYYTKNGELKVRLDLLEHGRVKVLVGEKWSVLIGEKKVIQHKYATQNETEVIEPQKSLGRRWNGFARRAEQNFSLILGTFSSSWKKNK